MNRYLISALGALILVGCSSKSGDVRIDGSSNDTYLASLQTVAKEVPPDKYKRFLAAASALRMHTLVKFLATNNGEDEELVQRTARMSLNGLTVDQVIEQGEKLPPQPKMVRGAAPVSDTPPLSDDQLDAAAMGDAAGGALPPPH